MIKIKACKLNNYNCNKIFNIILNNHDTYIIAKNNIIVNIKITIIMIILLNYI